ncbi:MAG: hypothetical protein A2534_01285 [Candidatus Magasanikbacteria bacterium RIFOXYD2_FULL_39_9]|nr:MAG: hypothetical protein A2534_01285 [Candidatus Magasanikbacteria bacterium RIFOXYD2_FULL_39_9]
MGLVSEVAGRFVVGRPVVVLRIVAVGRRIRSGLVGRLVDRGVLVGERLLELMPVLELVEGRIGLVGEGEAGVVCVIRQVAHGYLLFSLNLAELRQNVTISPR